MENYLVVISYDWQVIVLVIRDTTRNQANKKASKWLKTNRPEWVGKLKKENFKIHDFSEEGAGIVYRNEIYLG